MHDHIMRGTHPFRDGLKPWGFYDTAEEKKKKS